MAYTTQANLTAFLEQAKVVQGLDDVGAGVIDAALFSEIQQAVDNEIHGHLESRFPIPIPAPVPAFLKDAELVLEAELIWARRGNTGSSNPWTDRAGGIRERLADIRDNKAGLSMATSQGADAGGIVSEPSMTFSPGGRIPV